MDSSNAPTAAASDQESASKNSKMILSKRASFFASYRRDQNFAFPDSIMFYISQNPPSAKVYQKMIQSCKYFFVKNPILVMSRLHFEYRNGWRIFFNRKLVDFYNLSCKIWITDKISVENFSTEQNYFASTVPKIYQSDVKELTLREQIISFNDFIFMASKCELILFFENVTLFNEDESVVPLEKIVEVLPKLTRLVSGLWDPEAITTKTVKELIKLPNFANLTELILFNIPGTFDIETFYGFIKKNKKTKIDISFSDELPGEYRNRLQTIKDEIDQTENCDFMKPCIYFFGMH